MILRFPPYKDLRKPPSPPGFWQRMREWLNPPKKAEVFKFKNPTHWKLEQVRRKARGVL
jgi:hypothetical protein